jgi:hypothetical protein
VTPKRPVVYDGVRPDLTPRIRHEILDHMTTSGPRSAPSLNEGGWRSDDLRSWGGPATRELLDEIRGTCEASLHTAWAMVNWRGSRHPRHIHRGAVLAGVYYVHPGGPETPPTVFELPGEPDLHIEPASARLVVFPADLYHSVPVYPGDEPRITIAFDVR